MSCTNQSAVYQIHRNDGLHLERFGSKERSVAYATETADENTLIRSGFGYVQHAACDG